MKLSEMNVKQLSAALCQLVQPMSRIAKDESLNGLFADIDNMAKTKEHMTTFEKMGMLLEAVPVLLAAHYGDVIRIIAIMTGRTDAEVEKLNGFEMIDEMRRCIDSQFMSFFKSSAAMGKTETVKAE